MATYVLDQVEPESTPLLRDGVAEEPHVGSRDTQVVRDRVGRHDLQLTRDHTAADKVVDLLQDINEDVVGDVWISEVHAPSLDP